MRINQLKLENFQGIKALEIAPYGTDLEIRGDNATGKTTIGNAITWLLYGKPLDGAKNFSPKPKDAAGGDIHNLETRVDAVIDNKGEIMTLTKILKENWSRVKGSPEKTFKGNTHEYQIDGVAVTGGAFQDRLDALCPPDQVRLLTNPFHFPEELAWQDRRSMLLELCGDIPDSDVIAAAPELSELEALRNIPGTGKQHSIVDLATREKAALKKINSQLSAIPVRIDEAAKAMPDTAGMTKKALNAAIVEAKTQKADLEKQRADLSANTVQSTLEAELNRLTMENARQKLAFEAEENKKVQKARQEREVHEKKIRNLEEMQRYETRSLEEDTRLFETMTKARAALLDEYREVEAEQYTGESVCPTCGQPFPPEKIEEAQANWNEQKSRRLEAINSKGKTECSKTKIEQTQKRLEQIKAKLQEIQENIAFEHALCDEVELPEAARYEETETARKIAAEMAEIKEKMQAVDVEKEEKPLNAAIEALEQAIAENEQSLRAIDQAKAQKERIDTLKQEEKDLAAAYEHSEKTVYLCEKFVQAKAKLLTDSINSKFEGVRFQLFDTQINGGIRECCEVLVPSKEGLIPFNTANNAGRINAGIEIINAFSEHIGIQMPLIIDNAESVTKLLPSKNQMIKLVVDETARTLEVKENPTCQTK